jgi:hypothetical protein
MRSKIDRIVAVWFVLMIALPFTAPFPTCDFSQSAGGAQTSEHHAARLVAPSSMAAPFSDAEFSIVPPLTASAGLLRRPTLSATDSGTFLPASLRAIGPLSSTSLDLPGRIPVLLTILRL